MTDKHTPTPWTHEQFEGFSHMIRSRGTDYDVVVRNCSKANAAHIVKCVNMHDKLETKIQELKDREAKLVEVLRFYADTDNYNQASLDGGHQASKTMIDFGIKAKSTLKELGIKE